MKINKRTYWEEKRELLDIILRDTIPGENFIFLGEEFVCTTKMEKPFGESYGYLSKKRDLLINITDGLYEKSIVITGKPTTKVYIKK